MKPHPTNSWRRATAAGALLAAAAAAQPALAQTWALYDNFSNTTISSSKWNGEDGRTNGGVRLDERRSITGGQLRLEARGAGDTLRNTGTNSFRNTLMFARNGAVTGMKATITMRSASVGNCASNSTSSSVRGRLVGWFFNAGTPQPGSLYNDVAAQVNIYRNGTDPANTFRVFAGAFVCTDENCITSTGIPGGTDLLTGVTLDQPVEVSIFWDKANNQFKFSADSATLTVPYDYNDSVPASYGAKRLEVSGSIQQCPEGRLIVSGSADFDNVYTNPEALP